VVRRAAVRAKGQVEAAKAIGLKDGQVLRWWFPQALRVIIPR
jgi:ABC-type amino acid transport system permease subunit